MLGLFWYRSFSWDTLDTIEIAPVTTVQPTNSAQVNFHLDAISDDDDRSIFTDMISENAPHIKIELVSESGFQRQYTELDWLAELLIAISFLFCFISRLYFASSNKPAMPIIISWSGLALFFAMSARKAPASRQRTFSEITVLATTAAYFHYLLV